MDSERRLPGPPGLHNPAARSLPGQHSCGPAGAELAALVTAFGSVLLLGEAVLRHSKHSSLGWPSLQQRCSTPPAFVKPVCTSLLMHLDNSWGAGLFFCSPYAFPTHQLPPFCNPSCSPGVCAATVSAAGLALQMQMFSLHGVPTEGPAHALWGQDYELGRLHKETFRNKMLVCISDSAQH